MARSPRSPFQVLTANRLAGGEVVYAARGGWTTELAEAEILRSPESADARLKAAAADVRACQIVEPYLFGVEERQGAIHPVSVRETVRAGGPSISYGDR